MIKEVPLPTPLEITGITEPGTTGPRDLVGNPFRITIRRHLPPEAEHLTLLIVDEGSHVGVDPVLEARHLRPEDPFVDLGTPPGDEFPFGAVVPGVDRVFRIEL